MNFVAKIQESVEALGLQFCYGSSEELNEQTANIRPSDYPAAMCYLITDSQMVYVGSQMCEQAPVTIFFIDRTTYNINSIENEGIIQQCKAIADKWINSLRNGNIFRVTGQVNYRRIYLQFHQTVTGIGVNLTLLENVGSWYCEEPTIYLLGDNDGNAIGSNSNTLIEITR